MATRRTVSPAQREAAEQARRETVTALHQQLADGVAHLDDNNAWRNWMDMAIRFHRYSFNNTMLILIQNPDAVAVGGYRAWQALGHQVRAGEKAIKILGPVHRRVPAVNPHTRQPVLDEHGKPVYRREMVGVRPVSVFDASQVDPPVPIPPQPVLLQGEAPAGLWDALAAMITDQGFTLDRGACGNANGYTDYQARHVRVRADVSDSQSVKTLAHELGHVLLPPPPGEPMIGPCRGLREVEAESIAWIVTRAHGLDSSQYTFNYVGGWATQAAQGDATISDVISATGARVTAAVDQIVSRTQPDDLEARIMNAHAAQAGITIDAAAPTRGPVAAGSPGVVPIWETIAPATIPAAERALPTRHSPEVHPTPSR